MSKKVFLLIVVIIMVSLIGITSATAEESFLEKIKGAGIKADGKPIKVGICISELFSEFALGLCGYPTWLLRQAGCEVDFVSADNDLIKQIGFFEDFEAMGKEVIIARPMDDFALYDATVKAQAKGIKVFSVNFPVFDKDRVPIVSLSGGSPNVSMAEDAAKYLVEKAAGKKVKIVQMMGPMGQIIASERDRSFRAIIEKYPNIELVDSKSADWMTEKAYSIMIDMLTATPDLWGIYCQSDCMLPGIWAALEQAEKLYPVGHEKHIITVAIDGAPVALEKIREGIHDMTIEQSPYAMGCVVAKGVLMLAKGLDLPKFPDNIIEVSPVIITAENVNDPSLWGNFGVPHDELWPRTQEIFEYYKWLGDEKLYE
jgi:ABC-type sugar transport system substrate-binding protein